MQITIEIAPETQTVLRERAARRGMPLEAYLQSVIEDLGDEARLGAVSPRRQPGATLEEFERRWNEFCDPIPGLPPISDTDLSRAAIYSDHD